jgi:hypothetical protein
MGPREARAKGDMRGQQGKARIKTRMSPRRVADAHGSCWSSMHA